MASFNKVILMGNLTRDPEVKYLPDGTAVADIGLAVNETYKSKTGEQAESVCFVDVVVWRRQAETCGQYLSKGSPVLVEGRLQLDKWQTKDGDNRSKLRVRADRVQFLSGPKDSSAGSGSVENSNVVEAPVRNEAPVQEAPVMNDTGDDDNLPF